MTESESHYRCHFNQLTVQHGGSVDFVVLIRGKEVLSCEAHARYYERHACRVRKEGEPSFVQEKKVSNVGPISGARPKVQRRRRQSRQSTTSPETDPASEVS